MRGFLLGMRLLLGSGRGSRLRFLLMATGSSLGVCCLALVLTVPAILDASDSRTAARELETSSATTATSTLVLQRSDPYGSRPFTRVFIARGASAESDSRAVPPGLRALPGPGEVFVSPRVHELLRDNPAAKGLLPGDERGIISAAGLAHPDELFAYVGTTREVIAGEGRALESFGDSYAHVPVVERSTLTNVRFALATLVLLPLAVFLSICARLSAASRARRLAALRLLGMSRRGVQQVNAAETVGAALFGAVLGLGEYLVLNQMMSRVGLPALRWYPADGVPSAPTVALCLVGCPLLAWFVGRASARHAAANPLGVRRSAVPKPPRKWGGLVLVAGLGIVSGFCATGLTDRPATSDGLGALLVVSGVLLTGVGLVLALPWLSAVLARRIANSTGSLTLNMAMRRNETEPGSTMRVVTGLVLLVYAASLAQGILIELEQVTRPTKPSQDYSIALSQLTGEQQQALVSGPGVRAHAVTLESVPGKGRSDADIAPEATALVADCTQLAQLVQREEGCVDGKVMRLVNPNMGTDPGVEPGAAFHFPVRGGDQLMLSVTLPAEQIVIEAFDPSASGSADLLIPPSMLPATVESPTGRLVLVGDSHAGEVRRVLDGIGAVAPTVEVDPLGVNIQGMQQISVVRTLLGLGMIMGLTIGVAAFLVSVTDRAVERRPQVTALALIGARTGTMRAVQSLQVVLPLTVGLLIALVTGKLAESSYLVTGGGAVFWDFAGIPLLTAAALGVVVVATLGTLPLIGYQYRFG
ncbi:ABC transporter permease [Streptomyces sp. 12297]